ncbi:response regulator [Lusitaniella coriacea LEGE 07157]|uniref:Response regulator n=1 Tax=Lusitaniella coriacea LEGE 07157 TaxID=945747 RepID=A0A8J7J1Q9_9CYAN|nr:response regulator [Lusitaniella coriacea]MBE9115939.1 response regulator [Lusitaniella coriacea LEGE 07157]
MKILLVDDDKNLVEVLSQAFAERSYAIDVATDGEQGWVYGSTYTYDLIILDWSLPKLDGISLCRRFRDRGYDTPIILLTSRHGSQNTIRGLDAGADDYICKPFDIEELIARIRALLRRIHWDFLPILRWGELQLDPCHCQVTYQEKSIPLAAKEYRLLELFLRHSKDVLSIEEISESLWSSTEYPAEATVRSHLRHLRQKLKRAGLPGDIIVTIRGQGYCLKLPPSTQKQTESQPYNVSEKKNDKQSQHLAALTSAWEKYRNKSAQQLATLDRAITSLQDGTLSVSDRLSAVVAAHSLAGNLGLFGLFRGSQLAREIEQLLQNDLAQKSEQLLQLQVNLNTLRQELANHQNISRQISRQISKHSPLLLIVDNDSDFAEQLTQEAESQGIRTKIIATPELVKIWLEEQINYDRKPPDAVLLNISFQQSFFQDYLALIAEFYLLVPSIPAIVIADRDRFQDRLQVARHGSSFFLTKPISASQTIAFCQHVLQRSAQGKKILIVDDDVELLRVLPSLLQPWDFKLTTLSDPRQFWDILQAVVPDLLVLDIEMPHLSGIELCKVLRNHPSWYQLPVLFLSVHDDAAISTQVFASGANDFVNKPVIAQRLASRILNLLMRS